MKAAKLSIWNNKWYSVFDFTKRPDATANFTLKIPLKSDFIMPFERMLKIIRTVSEKRGNPVESFKQVLEEDIEEVKPDFNDSQEPKVEFADSTYFTQRSYALTEGLVPIRTAM